MNQQVEALFQKGLWGGSVPASSIQFFPPEENEDNPLEQQLTPETFKFHNYVLTPQRIENLKFFAQINPSGFRRIWLNFHYQMYRLNENFQEAKHSADLWIKSQIDGKRQYHTPARANQVLKKMTMHKQKDFIDFYTLQTTLEASTSSYTFNLFAEAAFADIEMLFCPDDFALQFISRWEGRNLKLDATLWDIILSGDFVDMNFAEVLLPGNIPGFKGVEETYRTYSVGTPSIRPSTEIMDEVLLEKQFGELPENYNIEF